MKGNEGGQWGRVEIINDISEEAFARLQSEISRAPGLVCAGDLCLLPTNALAPQATTRHIMAFAFFNHVFAHPFLHRSSLPSL